VKGWEAHDAYALEHGCSRPSCIGTRLCNKHKAQALNHPAVLKAGLRVQAAIQTLDLEHAAYAQAVKVFNEWRLRCMAKVEHTWGSGPGPWMGYDDNTGREDRQHDLERLADDAWKQVEAANDRLCLAYRELRSLVADISWTLSPDGRKAAEESADAACDDERLNGVARRHLDQAHNDMARADSQRRQ
jgi:hypothetical protein